MERANITKQELRNRYLTRRNDLPFSERREKSARIRENLTKETVYQKAQAILVYMSYRSEVETGKLVEELLSAGEKRVFAPKVEGMDIQFYEVNSMADFVSGYQGIREPEENAEKRFTEQTALELESLILVPGAVFDRERGRMGYGKGFYDRYLARFSMPGFHSAALAFDCQIARKVPVEEHDIRPDMIVTETGVIK
ncbi:MAG: 5-formyltetrahydrofolate cyclo-ligase [Clostridium sp.]|nr:5-formyltetrahydrofolate cyclo-ligase [Clostridium sp.]